MYMTTNGDDWELISIIDGASDGGPHLKPTDMIVYENTIYISTEGDDDTDGAIYDFSKVDHFNGSASSDDHAQTSDHGTEQVGPMIVYNGALYYGEGDGAGEGDLWRHEGFEVYNSSVYDRVTSLAEWNGELYVGFGDDTDDGDVYRMSTHPQATTSYGLNFAADDGTGKNATGTIWFEARDILGSQFDDETGVINPGTFMMSHALITNAGNYDIAEDYPTTDTEVESGTIMAFDPGNPGGVTKATDPTLVAGVTSAKPGFLLSQTDRRNMVPIALAGRVPVHVTNDNGDIEVGDSITLASSTAGYGMAANFGDQAVGYALEPADFATDGYETKTILVYVSLHTALGFTPDLDPVLDSEDTLTTTTSLFARMAELVSGFVDGVLSLVGLRANEICLTDDSGETCIDRSDLNALISAAGNTTSDNASSDDSDDNNDDTSNNTSPDTPSDHTAPAATTTATSTSSSTDTSTTTDTQAPDGNDESDSEGTVATSTDDVTANTTSTPSGGLASTSEEEVDETAGETAEDEDEYETGPAESTEIVEDDTATTPVGGEAALESEGSEAAADSDASDPVEEAPEPEVTEEPETTS